MNSMLKWNVPSLIQYPLEKIVGRVVLQMSLRFQIFKCSSKKYWIIKQYVFAKLRHLCMLIYVVQLHLPPTRTTIWQMTNWSSIWKSFQANSKTIQLNPLGKKNKFNKYMIFFLFILFHMVTCINAMHLKKREYV